MHLVPEILALLRARQWFRNLVLTLPLLAVEFNAWSGHIPALAGAVLAFSLLSASLYAFNDLCDQQADRWHPEKRDRPLARGAVTPSFARALVAGLAVSGLYGCYHVDPGLALIAALHLILGLGYSAGLKHIPWLDVAIISVGFALRVIAGVWLIDAVGHDAAGHDAVGHLGTAVLVAVCAFGAAVFALLKRRDELLSGISLEHRPSLRHLSVADVGRAAVAGIAVTAVVGATPLAGATWIFAGHAALCIACAARALTLMNRPAPVTPRLRRDPWLVGGAALYAALWIV